jgi:hypothetical protein
MRHFHQQRPGRSEVAATVLVPALAEVTTMAAGAGAVGVPTAADEEHAQAPVASWDPVQQPVAVVAGEAGEATARARAAYAHAPDHDHARVRRP